VGVCRIDWALFKEKEMSESKTLSVLEQTLVDTINATKSGISQGIDFAQQQIPEVVQQLLMWKMAQALIWLVTCLALIILCVYLTIKAFKGKDDGMQGVSLALSIFVGVPSVIGFIIALSQVIKIWTAPKLYLLEYVADLIR
jgi:hypothetical protein